ncbi:hypothetical protein HJ170_16905 [Vibrio parahaemolyticus]|nr:hypothetical protein [Vibrio parahaemolyticus]HCM0829472.1 hypothetical protein [Vibrio parahaemolyticus]
MFSVDKLSELAELKKRFYVSDVRIRYSDNALLLYVPRDKVGSKVTANFTSERQLSNVKKQLSDKYSVDVEVIYKISESNETLESSCFDILNKKFKDVISAFYMSFLNVSTVDLWIAAEELDDKLKEEISNSVNIILSEAELQIRNIQWINPLYELPSAPFVLKELKIRQPISLEELSSALSSEFPVINEKWLNRLLDKLRKKKFVSREKVGLYQLTELGLLSLPSAGSSNSLDVQRALALGRRKW